ncbi:unnamed protein product [Periconia digitata]|uniref:Uncharacterized protein n=1 Tax=Periconia digitata TaxID=1303443 RepID=A0A9W4XZ75_9PLEO|nr:unnamed protein product [Periconia digitata]
MSGQSVLFWCKDHVFNFIQYSYANGSLYYSIGTQNVQSSQSLVRQYYTSSKMSKKGYHRQLHNSLSTPPLPVYPVSSLPSFLAFLFNFTSSIPSILHLEFPHTRNHVD